MKINQWAENLTKEIYSEYQKKYSFWKPGLKVFYSPVKANPELMIISYQPGGNEKHFEEEDKNPFEKGDFSLQKFNSYSETDHKMSQKIRDLFSFDGGSELLKKSVVIPLIFFRAPTAKAWRIDIPKTTRLEMEIFSFDKVKEIIATTKPGRILVLGIETYNRLKEVLGSVKNEKVLLRRSSSSEKVAVSAELNEYKLFAAIHPSGARIQNKDWDLLKKSFKRWVGL